MSRLREFAKEVSLLRKEIVLGIPEDEPVTVTLSAEALAVIIYCLANAWLGEAISRLEGYEKITTAIGKVSTEIMSADLAPDLDKFIDDVLGGESDAA